MTAAARALALAVLAAGSSLLLAACGSKVAEEAVAELKARHGEHQDPFTTDVVARGVRELESKLGAPLKLFAIEVSQHKIVFSVQDPTKPGNVDAYELKNGVLMPPQPVLLMADTDVGRSVFEPGDVPLERIPELAAAAQAKVGIEEGKVHSLGVKRKFSAIPADMRAALARASRSTGVDLQTGGDVGDGGIAVELYVDSPRRKGYAIANQRFEIVRTSIL